MRDRVSVIIPAFNEERNIPHIIREIKKLRKLYRLEIIVVDDGSLDNTAKAARKESGALVIRLKRNGGKGRAFQKGVRFAHGDYVIQIDADLQFLPKEIPLFIEKLKNYDIVVGTRFNRGTVEAGSVSLVNLFGNWLMSRVTTLFSGVTVTDIMAGYKGFRMEACKKLALQTPHFGYEAEIIVKAGKYGLSLCEIPIRYNRRRIGSSNVSPIRDGLRVSRTITKLYFSIPGQSLGYGIFGNIVKTALTYLWALFGIFATLHIVSSQTAFQSSPWQPWIYDTIIHSYLLFFLYPLITGSFLSGLSASFTYTLLSALPQSNIHTSPFLLSMCILICTIISRSYSKRTEPKVNRWLSFLAFTVFISITILHFSPNPSIRIITRILVSLWTGAFIALNFLSIVNFQTHKDSLLSKRRIGWTFILASIVITLLFLFSISV
jgi:glycosyltransferase involved in cell wall biosynthesis